MPPNISLNFSLAAGQSCFSGNMVDSACVVREFCPQISGYLSNAALGLLVAFVVIDFALPLFLARILPGLIQKGLRPILPLFGNLEEKSNQKRLIAWARERLLFGMAILCGMILYFSNI